MGCALILYHGSIKERGFSRRAERQRIHEPALRKNSRNGSVRGYLRG